MYPNPQSATVNSALPTAWGLRLAVSAGLVLAMSMPVWAMEDGTTGRWLTRDPLGYVDGMSLYEYLRSSTPVHFDPLGTDLRRATKDLLIRWAKNAKLDKRCAAAIEVITSFGIGTCYNAPFSHCFSHCLISRYCGKDVSKEIGVTTEVIERWACIWFRRHFNGWAPPGLCESADQQTDYWDNSLGDEFAGRDRSCWTLCSNAMGGCKPPDGPPHRPWGPWLPPNQGGGGFGDPNKERPRGWPCALRFGPPPPGTHYEFDDNGNCIIVVEGCP